MFSDPEKLPEEESSEVVISADRARARVTKSNEAPLLSVTGRYAKHGTRAPVSTDAGATEWCRAHGIPAPVPGSESASFLDYWGALPESDRKSRKKDWAATWRNRPPPRAAAKPPPWQKPELVGNPNPVTKKFEPTELDWHRIHETGPFAKGKSG